MKFETKYSDIIRNILLFFVMLFVNINAASSKERAMYCVLKEPIYKFVDHLIRTDKVLEKIDGEWRSFCTGANKELNILDWSAKCSQRKPIFFAREISFAEYIEYKKTCELDKFAFVRTERIHHPYIWEGWNAGLNICKYFDLLKRDSFETKEKKERLLRTRFYVVETTESSYDDIIFLDFETKQMKYSKERTRITIPQNVRLVRPSYGTGQGKIRDVAGDPWDIINFSEKDSFNCENVELH